MNRPTNASDIDTALAERIKNHLDALMAGRAEGVTQPEAIAAGCHCNAHDCEECSDRTVKATELVMARHAEMYPAIADARDAAKYTDNPAAAIKKLEESMSEQIATLVGALADLRKTVAESTVPRDATPPAHEQAPKGEAAK